MRVHFILIAEGSSDDSLVAHLEGLCVEAGADEVTGTAPDLRRLRSPVGHTVAAKLKACLELEPQANLVLIHRDADSRDPRPRLQEIEGAVSECGLRVQWAPVVPAQETEAWLLLDQDAIRRGVGRPSGRCALGLPDPDSVEDLSNPKKCLEEALVAAAEVTGRRLVKVRGQFSSHRRQLLTRLPVGGRLSGVPSWVRMQAAIEDALNALRAAEPTLPNSAPKRP